MSAVMEQPAVRGYSVPAPIGGLNGVDAVANMAETDAVILDNWFPQPSWVESRGGAKTLGTFTGQCETLMTYNGITSSQLYAAVVNGSTRSVYRVDNLGGGAVGAPVVGGGGNTVQHVSSTQYDYAQFGTGSAEIIYAVNGADLPLLYDGATWQAISTVGGTYQLTGGPALTTLSGVAVYKQRIWFLQANTFNVWYLPQNVIGGALTQLNLAPNFYLGGYITSMVTVSIDNAAGLNDYIAFVSNVGEVVVFQGYDPSAVATWSLAAHFRLGHPVASGRKFWQKIGSDAAMLTADGIILMSDALLTDRSQTQNALSKKIRKLVNAAMQQYGGNFGWQIILYPTGNKVIVNVPTILNSTSFAFVMNTLTGAWCTFGAYASSWNSICYEVMGDNLYFGTNGAVKQADTNFTDDDGVAVVMRCLPAFSYFGAKGQLKLVTDVRLVMSVSGAPVNVGLALNVDFNTTPPGKSLPISAGNAPLWGNNNSWTAPTYWGSTLTTKAWYGLRGMGYAATVQLQIASLDNLIQWQATDYAFQLGGIR
jgi:hypothetical protein